MGNEEIIGAALHASTEHRIEVVRDPCEGDEDRRERLLELVDLAAATATESADGAFGRSFEPGSRLGRYLLQRHLGTGGMGSVYAAYDTKLDRLVALKILHAGVGRRLDREAKLLARVEHSNVVGVHDVGDCEGVGFIAMEYVEGTTLRQWMCRPRLWSEVLRVMVDAGRGLQAAHDAGVIHRDFKPENVLLSSDAGRVAVTDFGIARLSQEDTPPLEPTGRDRSPHETTSETRVGGTPAYMAPEQWDGGRVDARTDVFAFCVVLYEALWGSRPYPTPMGSALPTAIEIPASPSVPRWLAATVKRGLARDPGARWPSVGALLEELGRLRRRQRTRRMTFGLAVAAVLASGTYLVDDLRTTQGCAQDGRAIARTWNEAHRRALHASFARSELPFAGETAARVIQSLDTWADAWSRTRTETCLADARDSALRAGAVGARDACLDARAARLGALVQLLADADDDLIRHATAAVATLPPPSKCTDAIAREHADGASDTLPDLARAWAELSARRLSDAIASARQAASRARDSGDLTTALEAELLAAVALARKGDHEEARDLLRAVFTEAAGTGADGIAMRAATRLATVEGIGLAEPEHGRRWAALGEVFAARLRVDRGVAVAQLHHARGRLAAESGDYEGALEDLTAAATIAADALGEDHPEAVELLAAVGYAHHRRGEYERAEALHRRVLDLQASALGAEHPDVALQTANLALIQFERGAYAAARQGLEHAIEIEIASFGADDIAVAGHLESLGLVLSRSGEPVAAAEAHGRALDIRRRTHGEEHPKVASSLHHLAVLEYLRGDFEAAARGHLRAAEIMESIHGPDHPDVAGMLNGAGAAYNAQGEVTAALRTYRRALEIAVAAFGEDHINVGLLRHNVGVALHKLERYEEALPQLRRGLDIAIAAWGADHPRLVELHRSMANTLSRRGRFREALEASERAVTLAEAHDGPPVERARARFALAQALVRADADQARAVHSATRAAELYREIGAVDSHQEVQRWIDDMK